MNILKAKLDSEHVSFVCISQALIEMEKILAPETATLINFILLAPKFEEYTNQISNYLIERSHATEEASNSLLYSSY